MEMRRGQVGDVMRNNVRKSGEVRANNGKSLEVRKSREGTIVGKTIRVVRISS